MAQITPSTSNPNPDLEDFTVTQERHSISQVAFAQSNTSVYDHHVLANCNAKSHLIHFQVGRVVFTIPITSVEQIIQDLVAQKTVYSRILMLMSMFLKVGNHFAKK